MNKYFRVLLSAALLVGAMNLFAYAPSAVAVAGDTDYSLQLNGTSQYASAAEGTAFVPRVNYSVEAWVKPTDITCSSKCPIFSHDGDYTVVIISGFYKVYVYYNGTTLTLYDTLVKAQLNTWQHIAFTKSGSAIAFYLNGIKAYSATISGYTGITTYTGYAFKIGWHYGADYFPGVIDDARLWSVQRSDSDVVTDMQTYVPTNSANLIAAYDCNEGSGSTLTNVVSSPISGTNLTIYSSATFLNNTSSTTANGRTYITFAKPYLTSFGGFKIPATVSSLQTLIVAGGGGGGGYFWAGGGGAGGIVYDSNYSVTPNSYLPIVVGGGGSGGKNDSANDNGRGFNGADSWVGSSSFVAKGGGGGSGYGYGKIAAYATGSAGGSSGGGSEQNAAAYIYSPAITQTTPSGADTSYGNIGGAVPTQSVSNVAGSGGGGAGGVGTDAVAHQGGAGGIGINTYSTFLAGVSGFIGGGGGGGGDTSCGTGTGGGGSGGCSGTATTNGTALTGGGGGGGYNSIGGFGGSGAVVISYLNSFGASITISVGAKKTTKSAGASAITATTTSTGTVTFYANGRIINGCKNVAVSGTTATCNWRPMTHGQVTLTATYTSNDAAYAGSASAPAYVTTVSKRTTAR